MLDEMMGGMLLPRTTDDGTARGQRALVVTAVLTGLSIVIVAMRMYARVGLMKLTGREDYMILTSLVLSCTYLGLVAAEVHFGLGKHDADLSDVVVKEQLKRLWAAIPFYNASLIFTKFSILFQYLRIFPDRRFRLACWIVFGIVATYGTWAVVSGFLNCVPVAKFWNRNISGYCLSFEAVWFFNASMNIATDTTLLILPMPLLSQLQLPRMQKFALMGVFAIGGLVVITSILRLSSLRSVAKSTDTSYSNVGAAYWTAAECNVAIICACLPFLRPIVSRIFPRFLSTNSYNRYTRNPTMTASRMTATRMTARSHRQKVELYSQDRDYGMYTIDVKSGEASHDSALDGIAVTTTTMIQETSRNNDESTSQRRLVVDV
ncbi:PTH11-like integral membrane protein [Aspergillus niger]|uniref:PTH11-like integral membrane protein n=1 Tax=Aspergillus lacticoffeatus (strain CBS 101883) TaxID=1450533 RepID=UPI000D7F960D|nr:PTH11-like integral membrane protein [Aspergillus niger CBS 101883]PYH51407.1 PTH11-like integral membrane protein [Aspergillus niger CBS 101883]GJP94586.1 PTH11-like integral membrane protein [Aspergillus niger]